LSNISILGFDILPMSSTARHEGVRLAASAIFADGTTKEWSEISRDKLLKLVNKYKFRYLGTDNPSEIIQNNESIGSFYDLLPSETALVHVNLTQNGTTQLITSLFFDKGVTNSRKKLSPVKTARGIVSLIQQGVGMILEPYENETLINVGRPSGSSKGGWSQARYQRQAEEVVAREANKIKEQLDRYQVPYDEIVHSTKYGAKLARFHVFKSRSHVDQLLSNHSFYPANVKIWSPKKQLVTHTPLKPQPTTVPSRMYTHLRRLIVGIDPGMTTGVAIMNLGGKIEGVFSKKNLSKGELVTEITNYGVPILVCADVSPVPNFVSKFASTYNAEIFSPSLELSKEDKRALANQLDMTRRLDSHERDAIAAVTYAFRNYQENFSKIDQSNLGRKEKDLAKGLLVRGLSIKDSIASVNLLEEQSARIEGIKEDKDYHEKDLELIGRVSNLLEDLAVSEDIISNLRAHSGRLEAQNATLLKRVRQLDRTIQRLQDKQTRDILQTEIMQEKDRQINNLSNKLDHHKRQLSTKNQRIEDLEEMIWLSIEKGGLPVKILDKFSHDAINELRQQRGLDEGDIVLILDPTGGGPQTAANLSQVKLGFVFIEKYDMPEQAREVLYQRGIAVRHAEKYSILRSTHLGLINQQNYLQAKSDYAEYVSNRQEQEKTNKIFQTIENYKYERAKELNNQMKSYDDYELDDEDFIE